MPNVISKISNKLTSISLKSCRIIMFFVILFFIVFYAWVSDDAYQGFAQIVNLFDGGVFGYNMNERVNTSTCILFEFLMMIPYGITGDLFWSALIINILSSGFAIYILLFKFCDTKLKIMTTSVVILTSYYFLCFCTSGLENSLIFMFSAMFIYMYLKTEKWTCTKLLLLALTDSCLLLTRLDMAIIFLAPTAYIFLFRRENKSIVKMVLTGLAGLLPVICWLVFSLWYYGIAFPTTYYAKLNAGVPKTDMILHGLSYMFSNFLVDIIFFSVMLFTIYNIISKGGCKYKIFGFSLAARLIYIILIGGDFMYGRMLTDVFFMSLCLYNTMDIKSRIINVGFISRNKLPIIVFYIAIMVASCGCETLILSSMLKSGNWQCMDERYYYAEQFSIQSRLGLPVTGDIKNPYKKYSGGYYNHNLNKSAAEDCKSSGYKGLVYDGVFQGSIKCEQTDIYITDTSALGDLFLAQLKMTNYSSETWRVGHNFRAIPEGYEKSLQYDDNLIENESLREYYDVILELTRGDLSDKNRLQLIWDFNTGKYDHLLDEYYESLMS